MTKARARDQFLYALLAVIFGAAAVVVTWSWADSQKTIPKVNKVWEMTAQTPNELMQELQKTVDPGVTSDFEDLRLDAGEL